MHILIGEYISSIIIKSLDPSPLKYLRMYLTENMSSLNEVSKSNGADLLFLNSWGIFQNIWKVALFYFGLLHILCSVNKPNKYKYWNSTLLSRHRVNTGGYCPWQFSVAEFMMIRFECSLVREVSAEVNSSHFLSTSAQSSLALFLVSSPERISRLVPLVLSWVLPDMFLLYSAEFLSIPSSNPTRSLVGLFLFFAIFWQFLRLQSLFYVFTYFLSVTTCFSLTRCWSHCSHIYVKCLCMVSGYTITLLQYI